MREFFSLQPSVEKIEQKILELLPTINNNFHAANCEHIEKVTEHFKAINHEKFSDDFLKKVYDSLIEPARVYGYYDDRPESERPGIYRTTSAMQYHGDAERFGQACSEILSSVEKERLGRFDDRAGLAKLMM